MSRSFPFGRTIIRAVERSTSGSACQELKLTRMKVWLSCLWQQKRWLAGEGEGKGGGTGGTIRSAGGPFGKKQVRRSYVSQYITRWAAVSVCYLVYFSTLGN